MRRRSFLAVALWILASSAASSAELRVLVFTRTTGFRHDSIPAGIELVERLGREHRFVVETTENPRRFTPKSLRARARAAPPRRHHLGRRSLSASEEEGGNWRRP